MTSEEYHINFVRDACGRRGIDKALNDNEVDILMGPGDGPFFSISGTAGQVSQLHEVFVHYADSCLGYPGATLPVGYLNFNGRPFGLQIIAKAHQEEGLLIQAQSSWEATFPKRQPPPPDEINPRPNWAF